MIKVLKILFKPLIIILIVFTFYTGFSMYLDKEIDRLYKKNETFINHINGLSEKDKGNVLIDRSLFNDNMLVMGSSELSSPVRQNLTNLFPNNLYKSDISLVGSAYVQNALHAINLGANYESLKSNDIIIIESLQWFMGDDINFDGFFSHFSELQFYEFLNNKKISKENKDYLCSRYIQLENDYANNETTRIDNILPYNLVYNDLVNDQTYLLAKLYSSNKFIDKIIYQILKPYYWGKYQILKLKDKYHSYIYLKNINFNTNDSIVEIDWDEMYDTASKEGKTSATNNDLYVYDDYYTKYLEPNYESIKDSNKDIKLLNSKEWEDFNFFLSVCDDLEIKPYIIIMSTNGFYYDYAGLIKETRDEYYYKIEEISTIKKFDVLNLQKFEYTPYFYCDVMHLGWKGWPYVVQNTIEYFSQQ